MSLITLLLEELRGLMAAEFDLGLIGIPEDGLDALLHDADDEDRAPIDDDAADTIPEPPAEPITQPGDIWALGAHRLICGDATDPAVVARLMQDEAATLVFTSPPYAQQRDYGAAKEQLGDWDALMQGVFAAAPVTETAQLLVNLGLVHRDSEWIPYWEGWVDWMRAQGWRRFGWYIWDQGPGLPGCRIPDSVFRVMRHKGGLGTAGSHPAVFPVALVEAVLAAFTDPGDLVYEPFCGSGSQLIAAERAGRRCCAVELDPAYCGVAVRRWEMATGRTASRVDAKEEGQKPSRRLRKHA